MKTSLTLLLPYGKNATFRLVFIFLLMTEKIYCNYTGRVM